MKLFANIKTFAADESGAVTVDWVVLTAAIVGLGIAVIASVRTGTTDLATDIENSLSGATVNSLGALGSVSAPD
jgi:Flp pilus assembly pilin Flp